MDSFTKPAVAKNIEKAIDEIRSLRIKISEMERRRNKQFEARLEVSSILVEQVIRKVSRFSVIVGLFLGLLGLILIFAVPHYSAKKISGMVEEATIIVARAQKEKNQYEDHVREELIKKIPQFQVELLDVNDQGQIPLVWPDGMELTYIGSRIVEMPDSGKRQIMFFQEIMKSEELKSNELKPWKK